MAGPIGGAGAAMTSNVNMQRLLPLLMGLGSMYGQRPQQQGQDPLAVLRALGGGQMLGGLRPGGGLGMPQPFWQRGAIGPAG